MTNPAESDARPICPKSQRVDGPWHSERFDGDDPYTVCVYCGERRDALTGRVLPPTEGDA